MGECTAGSRQRSVWRVAAAGVLALAVAACSTPEQLASPGQQKPMTASVTPVAKNNLPDLAPASPSTTGDPATAAMPEPVASPAAAPALASAPTGQPLRIGLLLPLAGFDQNAQIAKGMKQAAEMALFEGERSNVQLIVKDDKGTAEGAKAAAEEAVKEGAEIVLGPMFSRAVAGAASVTRPAGIPLVTFSNDRQVAGSNVYVMGFSPEQDADAVVAYAARQGKKRFAALLPDDAYGQVIGNAFRNAVTRAGGTVVASETYPAGANAMIGPSRRIVEAIRAAEGNGSPIEAVFVPGGADVLPQLGPLLAYAGFSTGKVKLLGSGAWEFANVGNNDVFVGGWYPGPDPQGWRAFTGRFAKAFGVPPPRMASIAYDAVQIAIALSGEAKGQRFTQSNLARPAGFAGVDGTIRLRQDGFAERELAILEVAKTGSVIVETSVNRPATASAQDTAGQGGDPTAPAPARVN